MDGTNNVSDSVPALLDQYFELEVEMAVAGISVPPAVTEMLLKSKQEVESAESNYSAAIRTFKFRLATFKRLLSHPGSERQVKRPRTAAKSTVSIKSSDVAEVFFPRFS